MKIRTITRRLEKLNKDLKCCGKFWLGYLPIKEFKIENGINVITCNKADKEEYTTVGDALKRFKLLNSSLEYTPLKQIKSNEYFCFFDFNI